MKASVAEVLTWGKAEVTPALGKYDLTPDDAQRLLYDAPIGVAVVGVNDQFSWVNDAFCKLLDYTEGQLLRLQWADITCEAFRQVDESQRRRLMRGEIQGYTTIKAYRKSGWRPEHPRECYGTLTVLREPILGEFKHYWVFFVPHDIVKREDRWTQITKVLELAKDNYRWIILAIAMSAGLAGGNWREIFQRLLPHVSESSPLSGSDSPASP